MENRLYEIETKYNFLSEELTKEENIKDLKTFKKLSKEKKEEEERQKRIDQILNPKDY